MIVHSHIKQKNAGDPTMEWLGIKLGKVTASEISSLVTDKGAIKTGEGPKTYLAEKLTESWQGSPLDMFGGSLAMSNGNILEESAIPYAALMYDLEIKQVGFIETHDGRAGCSPDGVCFGDDPKIFLPNEPTALAENPNWTGMEIKCPELKTHVKYLIDGKLPAQYMPQVQFSMWVTGCNTWHFMSWSLVLPAFHVLVDRDEQFQDAISEALAAFYPLFDNGMKRLQEINGGPNKNRVNLVPKRDQPSAEMVDYKV